MLRPPAVPDERFRSREEVEWAQAFDRVGLQWDYEPLKFDLGPDHHSYTPDFKVAGLVNPDSTRALYIEVQWFGEAMDLTKYVRFTEWYNCDLLVLRYNGSPYATSASLSKGGKRQDHAALAAQSAVVQ